MRPNPQGHLFQLGAPIPPAPPWVHNYLAFPAEGRRRREKGRGVPSCCCPRSPLRAPSLPDRKPAPIPSQLQLCHPPPPQAHGVTHCSAGSQRLRPGSSATAPRRLGLSRGRPQLTGPSSGSLGLAPQSPTLAPRGVAYAGPDRGPLPEAH